MRNRICILLACWVLPCLVPPCATFGQGLPQAETAEVETDFVQEDAGEGKQSTETQPLVRLLKVPLPIQGTVDTQVRRSIEQILSNAEAAQERPIIVLEFVPPQNGTGESSEFGRALDLARYLVSREANQARIVAYIPETVRGHAVLVVLACEEIVMHPDAQLGEAGISESDIDDTMRRAYSEIAGRRLTIPAPVAMGLLDPELQVQRLITAQGTRYALDSEIPQIQAEVHVQRIEPMIPAGDAGLLVGEKLRLEYRFVSHLAEDRKALAAALNVPPADLEIDPLLTGSWSAIRIDLNGPVGSVLVDQTLRSLEDALKSDRGINFVCLAIDSPGGSLEHSLRLATYLSDLDSARIRTVAYVPREARSDAAWIAMACDKIAIHAEATLGGGGASNYSTDQIEAAVISMQAVMSQKDRSWTLPVAMIDPERTVHRYQLIESNAIEYFCDEELKKQRDPDAWERGEEISARGDLLQLTGKQAQEFRIAHQTVADYAEFQQAFQLESPLKC